MIILNVFILRCELLKIRRNFTRNYCDILPSSEIKLIRKKKLKNNRIPNTQDIKENTVHSLKTDEFRVNNVNIQMISKNIYEQLFKKRNSTVSSEVIKR